MGVVRGGEENIMTTSLLSILFLAFAQNVSFTIVSRSRNRSSFRYHMIAAVFSNSIWFLTFRELILANMTWLLFIPYLVGTVAGSLTGAKISMWIERKLDARSDDHLGPIPGLQPLPLRPAATPPSFPVGQLSKCEVLSGLAAKKAEDQERLWHISKECDPLSCRYCHEERTARGESPVWTD